VKAPPWALAELDAAFPLEPCNSTPRSKRKWRRFRMTLLTTTTTSTMACVPDFLNLDTLLSLPSLATQWRDIEARFPGAPRERLLRELVRGQIGRMV